MAAKTQPLQTSFNGGILSPKLRHRVDTAVRAASVATCDNFIPTPYGTLVNRQGSNFLEAAVNTSPRLETFKRRRNQDAVVELGATTIQLWNVDGKIPNNVSDNLLVDPNLEAADPRVVWDYYSQGQAGRSEDGDWQKGLLAVPGFPAHQLIPTGWGVAETGGLNAVYPNWENWNLLNTQDTWIKKVGQNPGNVSAISCYGITDATVTNSTPGFYSSARVQKVTTAWAGNPHAINFTAYSPANAHVFVSTPSVQEVTLMEDLDLVVSLGTAPFDDTYGSVVTDISAYSQVIPVSSSFTPGVDEFYITIELVHTGGGNPIIDFGSVTGTALAGYDINVQALEVRATQAGAVNAGFISPWTDAQVKQLHVCQDVAKGRMFFFHENVAPHELFWDGIEWFFGPLVFSGGVPDNSGWGDALAGGLENWPSTCAMHKGRLWAGATPLARSRLWGSEVDEYGNWVIPTTPVASDPVDFTLATSGEIEFLLDSKNLMVGADIADVYGTSSGGVITGTDFNFPKQASWGAAPVQAVEIGNETVHVTADGVKLRALWDDGDTSNGYKSKEASYAAQHLFALSVISEITYGSSPHYQLTVLAGGKLVHCTYEPSMDLASFYTSSTDGDVTSSTYTREDLGDRRWQAVSRGGSGNPLLEYFNPYHDIIKVMMDSSVTQALPANLILPGLAHLERKFVGVVGYFITIPAVYYGEFEVINGLVDLSALAGGPVEGAVLSAGLVYECTTALLEPENGEITGTGFASKKRYSDIYLRVNDSIMPRVNGVLPQERYPEDPMNLSPPLVAGLRDLRYKDVGFTEEGILTVTQDIPMPTEIVATFGKLKTNTR
jgi:hypothetical protein